MTCQAEWAAQLLADSPMIIDILVGGASAAPLTITVIRHGERGSAQLDIRGWGNRPEVVECSTNLVDWIPVGVTRQSGEAAFEFDHITAESTGPRY